MPDRTLPLDFRSAPREGPPEPEVAPKPDPPRPFSVAELDRVIRESLEGSFRVGVWVEGEVTGARPAPSGHVYLCLKDEREDASIDVVVYKNSVSSRARALLKDGARVRLRGRPTFYSPRGRLQFVADRVDPAGRGAILEALERLKEKLSAEGLFAPERKRRLPAEPRIIGVVTSPTGAVIHDVCKVAFQRGGARILLAPARVQGDGAAESILYALRALQRIKGVDVIIVGRGGGSADDLLAFNDEALVRAVAASTIPVVSAVGHEVDVTLVDFAADARAATPSQAAEMVVPDSRARAIHLRQLKRRLVHSMRARLAEDRVGLNHLERKLADPRLAIASQQQRLDDRTERLAAWSRRALRVRREHTARLEQRLSVQHPQLVIARERRAVERADDAMRAAIRAQLARRVGTLERVAARLDALSPLKVLGRGYAIAARGDGRAVRSAQDVKLGDRIVVRVETARLEAEVTKVEEES